jgi:hypothetical protein
MSYFEISATTTIDVYDLKSLMQAWKLWGGSVPLVGTFRLHKRLTPAQRRRLPAGLRERLK